MSHLFIFNLRILCIYLLGYYVEYCSSADDCQWSTWTELDDDQIQHRARECDGKSMKAEIESRNCHLTTCNISNGENGRTTRNPLESTSIERVNVSNHPGVSNGIKGEATLPTTRHHGKLSQNSTYTREETIDSTQYKRKTTKTTPIIGESKSDSDKSKTKLESSTHVRRETVGTTQFNNTITRIILESMVDEKNQSKLETASVTEDVIVLRNVSPKSDFGYAACEQRKEQELNGFRYVKECLISVLALILVIAVTALWCERQKRLKCERERLYIFSLPQNTELTSSEEDDTRYNTMTDFTRLFSGSSAERLSSCVYQDITDMVSSEFSSPRSTYQQIPFRHSKQSNSGETKSQDLTSFI